MKASDVFKRRFNELLAQAEELDSNKYEATHFTSTGEFVDNNQFQNWKVKVRSLLSILCSEDSQYYRTFVKKERESSYGTNHGKLLELKSIFLAAKEDFEAGYLSSLKSIVQADVFDNELEQAEELFRNNYHTAAAVVAGVVLETGIRELCDRHSIPHDTKAKLDKMNADLAKAGVYTKLVQKQVTWLAGIRNSAAHGHPEEFTKEDVEKMIRDVRDFLGQNITC